MSYEGTTCPCGDKKIANTMLCNGCVSAFSQHPAMSDFENKKLDTDTRRHAAMTLLSLARGRKSFNCPECTYQCMDHLQLVKHLRAVHNHSLTDAMKAASEITAKARQLN